MMFGLFHRLAAAGVLGINGRNADYTLIYNRRQLYPLVDDKIITKECAKKAGIPVPESYGVIELHRDVRHISELVQDHPDFVIKPAHGTHGKGILVIDGVIRKYYHTIGGQIFSEYDMRNHLIEILGGLHSIGGQPDRVLIEYRVNVASVFRDVAFRGAPDIRVVVFLGVPVMAMLRLPTRHSGGKSNLHQGAIGAGVDMATGRTIAAAHGRKSIEEHPDTGFPVIGLHLPEWPAMLAIAARSFEMTGLGYQGIDLVLDRRRGPLLLEVNARPGLSIQIANLAGLRPRLEAVKQERWRLSTVEDRIAFAQERFGNA